MEDLEQLLLSLLRTGHLRDKVIFLLHGWPSPLSFATSGGAGRGDGGTWGGGERWRGHSRFLLVHVLVIVLRISQVRQGGSSLEALHVPLRDLADVRKQELEAVPDPMLPLSELLACLATLGPPQLANLCADAFEEGGQGLDLIAHLLGQVLPRRVLLVGKDVVRPPLIVDEVVLF